MKYTAYILSAFLCSMNIHAATIAMETETKQEQPTNHWKGKKVAYLGDSITDKIHVGTTKNYWQYLEESLGIEPLVYGINGDQWDHIYQQAEKLKAEQGDKVDAIFIFAGTNDFYGDIELGRWYDVIGKSVEVSGRKKRIRKYRTLSTDEKTFRGRINRAMAYLKHNFPMQQIVLLTPIHRGYACFGDNNIQPDESYANQQDLYIDDYVQVIKEAGNVWAVPVIDLNSISGLYPLDDAYVGYFHNEDTDRLHPNAEGHKRMAKAIQYQLMGIPSDFKE